MGRSNVHTQRTTHPPNLAANYFYKNVRPNCQPSPQRGNQWLINGTMRHNSDTTLCPPYFRLEHNLDLDSYSFQQRWLVTEKPDWIEIIHKIQ